MKKFNIILVISLIIVSLISMETCNTYKERNKVLEDTNYTLYNTSDSLIRKENNLVEQKQLIVDLKSKIAKQEARIENLKRINSKVRVETKTIIKEIRVPFKDTVDYTSVDSLIKVPRKANYKDDWTEIDLTVQKRGVDIDSLSTIDSLKIIIGEKKEKGLKNIFKDPVPIVKVENKNPNNHIVDIDNIVVKKKKKKKILPKISIFLAGVIGGLLLSK